jgi:hypothetical protein
MSSSITLRRARAPVSRLRAFFASSFRRFVGELQFGAFHLEELLVLADQRVLGLGEDLHQRLDVSGSAVVMMGSRPTSSGIMPNSITSSGVTCASTSL